MTDIDRRLNNEHLDLLTARIEDRAEQLAIAIHILEECEGLVNTPLILLRLELNKIRMEADRLEQFYV
jgi:hypothetical protein